MSMSPEEYEITKKMIIDEREKQQKGLTKKYKIDDHDTSAENKAKYEADTGLFDNWKEEKLKALDRQKKIEDELDRQAREDLDKGKHIKEYPDKDKQSLGKSPLPADGHIHSSLGKELLDGIEKLIVKTKEPIDKPKQKEEKKFMSEEPEVKRLQEELKDLRYELKNAPKEKERDDTIKRAAKESEDTRRELRDFKDKEFKEVCHGIECLKNDMKKLHETLGQKFKKDEETCQGLECLKKDVDHLKKLDLKLDEKFDSLKRFDEKFDGIKTDLSGKFDTVKTDLGTRFDTVKTDLGTRFDNIEKHTIKLEKIEKDVDSQCKGMECLKNFDNKLDVINKNLDLAECPKCKKKAVPYKSSWCPFCNAEIPGWADDNGEPVKDWVPAWSKINK